MKDNKLLAKYLGVYKEIAEDHKAPGQKLVTSEGNDWQPDKCWNQLMMVVEKIGKECAGFIPWLCIRRVLSDKGKYQASILSHYFSYGDTQIEAVYNACVVYIESK